MYVYYSEELDNLFILDEYLTIRKRDGNHIVLMEVDTDSHTWLPLKDFNNLYKLCLGRL